MARARNIKPGFFTNDELVELPFEVRLLFIGLWTIADREGRLADRPKKIKMEIFPADDVDCDNALEQLSQKGFLRRYEVEGSRYIQIVNWEKHQNPHIKEAPSAIPAETGKAPEVPVQAPEIPEQAGLIPDSLIPDSLIPDSGLLDSAPQEVASPSAPPARKVGKKKPTPIPEDFTVSEGVKAWAAKNGYSNLAQYLEFFTGRMRANGKTYIDWDQAFMNCIREDWAKLRQPAGYQQGAPPAPPVSRPIPSVEDQVPSLKVQRVPGLGSLKDALKKRAA